jgi:hypothetical protein
MCIVLSVTVIKNCLATVSGAMMHEVVRDLVITVFAVFFITEYIIYLNLLIVQGYDNSESFIITQDPLESTIADFWRMVSEQSISTLVMLSDVSIAQPLICLEMSSFQEKREIMQLKAQYERVDLEIQGA